jgi:hypothetical protein
MPKKGFIPYVIAASEAKIKPAFLPEKEISFMENSREVVVIFCLNIMADKANFKQCKCFFQSKAQLYGDYQL